MLVNRIASILAAGTVIVGASAIAVLPATAASHHSHHRSHHRKHPHTANPIPQHNGGDRDADNNGGPSDGDGNV
jgi:Spy/CpxP family protein refolding chaperone